MADFDDSKCQFTLENVKESWSDVPAGEYQFILPAQNHTHGHAYRLSSPLATHIIHQALDRKLEPACVIFDLSGCKRKIGLLEPFVGCTGWMQVSLLTVASLEAEDRHLFALIDSDGNLLDQEIGEKLFRLNGTMKEINGQLSSVEETLDMRTESLKMMTLNDISQRNSRYFDEEITKLDRWADDLKHGLETEIKDIQTKVNQIKKEARIAPDLQSKLDLQQQVKELEVLRNRKRRELFDAEDEIDSRKETLISSVEARLQQEIDIKPLFTIQWELV